MHCIHSTPYPLVLLYAVPCNVLIPGRLPAWTAYAKVFSRQLIPMHGQQPTKECMQPCQCCIAEGHSLVGRSQNRAGNEVEPDAWESTKKDLLPCLAALDDCSATLMHQCMHLGAREPHLM